MKRKKQFKKHEKDKCRYCILISNQEIFKDFLGHPDLLIFYMFRLFSFLLPRAQIVLSHKKV